VLFVVVLTATAAGCFSDHPHRQARFKTMPIPPETPQTGPPEQPIPFSIRDASLGKIAEIEANIRAAVARGERLSDRSPKMQAIGPLVEIAPDDVVADIGAGTGFFAMHLLEHDRPFRKLFAVDPDPFGLNVLLAMLEATGHDDIRRVEAVLSSDRDVKLRRGSIDVAVVVDVPFFEASRPGGTALAFADTAEKCLRTLRRALKPDGRLYVFESKTGERRRTVEEKRFGFDRVGFTHVQSVELPEQDMFFMVFRNQ